MIMDEKLMSLKSWI